MANQYAREPFDSRSTSVDTTNWVSAVVMCFVVIAKLSFKWTRSRKFQIEDFFIIAAMAVALGESIAVSREVSNGLGQHQVTLTLNQAQTYRSPYYAAQILYVAAVCTAKLVIASMLAKMRMIPRWVIAAGFIVGLSVSWALAVMSALAVRCVGKSVGLDTPMSCIDEIPVWKAAGVVDIVTDVMLVALAALIIIQAEASLKNRLGIILAFASKLICIPLIVLRIRYLDIAIRSPDGTYEAASAAITTQLSMNVGIIATCVPYLKSFLSHMDHGTFTYDYRLKAARRKGHGQEIEKASMDAAFAEASQTSQRRQAQAAATLRSPQRSEYKAPPRVTPQKRRSDAGHGYRSPMSPRRQGLRPRRQPAPVRKDSPPRDSDPVLESQRLTPASPTAQPKATSPRDLDTKQLPAVLAISPSVSDREIQSPLAAYQRRSIISRRRSASQRGERRLSRLLSQVSPDDLVVETPTRHPPMSLTNTLAVLEEMQASENRNRRSSTRTQIIPAARRKPSTVTIKKRNGAGSGASSAAGGHQPLLTPVLEISPSGSSIEPDKPSPLRISPAKLRHEDGRTFFDVSSNTSQANNTPPGSRGQRSRSHSHKQSSSSESRRQQSSTEESRHHTSSSESRPPVSPLDPSQQLQSSSEDSYRQVTPPSRDEPPNQPPPINRSISHSPDKRPQTATSSESRLQTAKSSDTVATAPEYQPFDLTFHNPSKKPDAPTITNDGLANSPAGSRTPEEEQLIQDHKHLQVPTLTLNRSHRSYEEQQEQNDRQRRSQQEQASSSRPGSLSRPGSDSQTSSRFYAQRPPDHSPSSMRPEERHVSSHTRDVSSTSADLDRPVTALPQVPVPPVSEPAESVMELRLQGALPPIPASSSAEQLPVYADQDPSTSSTPITAYRHGYNTSSSSGPTTNPSGSGPSGSGPSGTALSAVSLESPHLYPSPPSDKKRKGRSDRRRPSALNIIRSNGSSGDLSAGMSSSARPVLGGNVLPAPLSGDGRLALRPYSSRDANRSEVEGQRARTPRSPLGSAKMVIRKLTTFGAYHDDRDHEGRVGS